MFTSEKTCRFLQINLLEPIAVSIIIFFQRVNVILICYCSNLNLHGFRELILYSLVSLSNSRKELHICDGSYFATFQFLTNFMDETIGIGYTML